MKNRKHKNEKSFNISFQVQSSVPVKFKGNVGGYEQREQRYGRVQVVEALGNTAGAVRKGFLFGRDRNNILIRSIVSV